MDIEELKGDLLHVLQNDDRNVLQKWKSSCREFRSRVTARIEERLLHEKDYTEKKSVNDRKVSKLQQEIDTMKSNVDAIVLELKITDKKTSNMIQLQESLKNELENAKKQRDTLSLEMVDLQLETKTKKGNKISQWDAIKRACHIYKLNLDIHISLKEEGDCLEVKFSYFTHSADTKDKYFVQLSHNDNHWKVEGIEPKLKREHFNQLSIITDSSECSKVLDLTLFLCQVRSIFLKYYVKMGKK